MTDPENVKNNNGPVSMVQKVEEKSSTKEETIEQLEQNIQKLNKSLKDIDKTKKSVNFDADGDFIAVVGISDLHYGNENVNMDFVNRIIDFVADQPRAYCFLNGDIIDNWVKLSPDGGIYEQSIKPEYQNEIMINKLEPIKDSILAVVYGNHEGRSKKQGNKNPSKRLAEKLDIAYLGAGGRINMQFGDNVYKMHIRHRFRYESSFNPCHACGRLIGQLDSAADIVGVGHKHDPAVEVRYKAGKQRSLMRFGSAMPSTSYSNYLGFEDVPLVAPTVIISGDKKMHHPFIDLGVVETYIDNRSDGEDDGSGWLLG